MFGCAVSHSHSSHLPLSDHTTWLSGAGPQMMLLLQLSNWRINLVCLLSGHLSRTPPSRRTCSRFVGRLLLPTLLWTLFTKPVVVDYLSGDLSYASLREAARAFTAGEAYHNEWYASTALCPQSPLSTG